MGCNFVWNHTYDMGPKLHDEVQLPLYYSRCKIAEFCQYQYYNDQLAGLLKSGNKKAFKSYFVFETEWYPIEHKWCDLKQQWCDLKSVKMIVLLGHPQCFTNTDEKILWLNTFKLMSQAVSNNHLQIVFFPMVYRCVTLCMGTFSVRYPWLRLQTLQSSSLLAIHGVLRLFWWLPAVLEDYGR